MSNPSLKQIYSIAFLVIACAGIIPASAKPIVLNSIRAAVNGEPITQSMLDAAVQTQFQVWLLSNKGMVSKSQAEKEIREMETRALDDLIDRTLILTEFERLGGNIKDQYIDESVARFTKERFGGDRDKFLAELQESGMTIAQFREVQRDQIAIQALRTQNSGDNSVPNTPWEKKDKYDEIKGEFASEGKVKLRIMSIPKQTPESSMDKQAALLKEIAKKLNDGSDFSALAKQYSADSFAAKGGYVGIIGRGTLNEGLTRAAYAIPTGQFSSPLDDGPFWRILKVEERVGQSAPSFDKMEDEADKRLSIDKRQKALETWLLKLRRDANVRIYEN
tara:strand:+ start:1526 stop:2527 length:1002 start_codon:yes stop_codon:yes gene_type:complete